MYELGPEFVRHILENFDNPAPAMYAGLRTRRRWRNAYVHAIGEYSPGFRHMTLHESGDPSLVPHDTWGFSVEVCTYHLAQEVASYWRNAHLGVTNRYPSVSLMHVMGPGVTAAEVAPHLDMSFTARERGRASSSSHRGGSIDRSSLASASERHPRGAFGSSTRESSVDPRYLAAPAPIAAAVGANVPFQPPKPVLTPPTLHNACPGPQGGWTVSTYPALRGFLSCYV